MVLDLHLQALHENHACPKKRQEWTANVCIRELNQTGWGKSHVSRCPYISWVMVRKYWRETTKSGSSPPSFSHLIALHPNVWDSFLKYLVLEQASQAGRRMLQAMEATFSGATFHMNKGGKCPEREDRTRVYFKAWNKKLSIRGKKNHRHGGNNNSSNNKKISSPIRRCWWHQERGAAKQARTR